MKFYVKSLKSTFIDAIHKELGVATFEACNIPVKEVFLNATKLLPLAWNGVDSFTCNHEIQSKDSFIEQHAAIEMCCQQINKYLNISDQYTFTKNVGIRGFPGSGKTWCSLYVALCALSKGLFVLPTALLAKRAIQLGGKHWHKMFHIRTDNCLGVHRRAELALICILRDAVSYHLLMILDILV